MRPLALSNTSEIAALLSSDAVPSHTHSRPGASIKRIVPDVPDGNVGTYETGWGYTVVVAPLVASGL